MGSRRSARRRRASRRYQPRSLLSDFRDRVAGRPRYRAEPVAGFVRLSTERTIDWVNWRILSNFELVAWRRSRFPWLVCPGIRREASGQRAQAGMAARPAALAGRLPDLRRC